MVKLIVGNRGTGKTKAMIAKVQEAAKASLGNVVCIEKGDALKFDLSYHIRLIDIEEYKILGAQAYYGFISGLLAGNYDITEIFGDATFKILCGKSGKDFDELTRFLDMTIALIKDRNITVYFTISCDPAELPDHIRAYMI